VARLASPRLRWAICLVLLWPARAVFAQDLFELEVFRYESISPGASSVEFHTNGMTHGAIAPTPTVANHRPVHMSVELTHGFTDRIESAVFIQTAPFGPSGSARFAGGHLRTKYRFGELGYLPVGVALSGEYTFNRSAFDRELQTFELRPIVDYRRGRLWLAVNPSVEVVTRGGDAAARPTFDLSAGAGWRVLPHTAVTSDYFSRAATTRHLAPEADAHHLLFAGLNLDLGPQWEMSLGVGHCFTSHEPWLMKSVIGYRF
jgi:hypothetical protein